MRRAALFVQGRVIVADSHLLAFETLTLAEQTEHIVSGFLDENTGEFDSDLPADHFFNKEMYLVRHGEVESQGEPDPPLSQYGIQEAQRLAQIVVDKKLSDFQFFTSPLLRCLQTAEIFSRTCRRPVKVDINL